MKLSFLILVVCIAALVLLFWRTNGPGAKEHDIVLKSVEHPSAPSSLWGASYLKRDGVEMVRNGGYSPDNGRTWENLSPKPDFDSKLPYGYRRGKLPLFVDPVNGRILSTVMAIDTPGLDPKINEPLEERQNSYLRYRVSIDGGKTYLFDEPIIQKDKTLDNPFDGIFRDKNAIFPGDCGSQIIRTRRGDIIAPFQATIPGPDGKLANPGGGFTWTETVMLIGRWAPDNRIEWYVSKIVGDPARSTRGMIEPTLAEMPDGRILCVMRGSNGGSKDPDCKLPSYKWISVSTDGGFHWSKPEPWTYEDGTPFYSPSSMSQLLKHSSGRIFWIGNLSETNCRANHPRYPLVIGEVDRKTLHLIRNSVLAIDTARPEERDPSMSYLSLSHFWSLEDRETKDIVIVGSRALAQYTKYEPVVYRIAVP
ncbi:MAG: sialidase family protein [Kiritimatiellaeota bacterium]|nr:sialidase family protein [Kiritimatiellota bacterium]